MMRGVFMIVAHTDAFVRFDNTQGASLLLFKDNQRQELHVSVSHDCDNCATLSCFYELLLYYDLVIDVKHFTSTQLILAADNQMHYTESVLRRHCWCQRCTTQLDKSPITVSELFST